MKSKKEHINPEGLLKSAAFSQIVTTQGNGKTMYIGGQNAVDHNSKLVGKNDIVSQTEQVMKNLETALKACGADFENLVKLDIAVVQGQDITKGFEASQKFLGKIPNPPLVKTLVVAGLGHPDWLLEIDAIAFLPDQ